MARVEHSDRGFERERYRHRRDSHNERRTSDRRTTRDNRGDRRDG